jgi:hypothetical protein
MRWRAAGRPWLAVAGLVGVVLLAQGCAYGCNQHAGPPFHSILGGLLSIIFGVVGCLGAIVFGLGAYAGAVVVLVMALAQLGRVIGGAARISKLQSDIASHEADRRYR